MPIRSPKRHGWQRSSCSGPPSTRPSWSAGPLPERSVRALGAALCSALDQLHRSDVVHRDMKPSNILLTAYGPKVIDFGIARAIGDDRPDPYGRLGRYPRVHVPGAGVRAGARRGR
ncbi:protein kinase domain-containing protein [Streptomyces sp. L7]